MPKMNGIEQGRARYAFQCASNAKANLKVAKEYKSYVKKIPMMIKTNGLGATFAFIFSKGVSGGTISTEKSYGLIYKQVADWMLEKEYDRTFLMQGSGNAIEFAHRITQLNSVQYRAATMEVLALFAWIRRYAEGLITGEIEG